MGKKSREKASRRDKFSTNQSPQPPGSAPPPPVRARPVQSAVDVPVSRQAAPLTGAYREARRFLSEQNPQAALMLLQRTVPSTREAAEHRNLVALCLVALHQYDQALPLLKAAASERALDVEMSLALAETQANMGMLVHMDRLVRKLFQAHPTHPGILQAREFAREQREQRAVMATQLEADPADLEEAIYLVEETYGPFHEEDIPQVIETLQQAIRKCPAYKPAQLSLATALTVSGNAAGAIATLRNLVGEPGVEGAQASAALIRLYVSLNQQEEAAAVLAALQESAVTPERRGWIAEAMAFLNEDAPLRDLLRAARDMKPREQFLLGAANARLGDLPSARRSLQAAINAGYDPAVVMRALEDLDNDKTNVPYLPALEMTSPRASRVLRLALSAPGEESTLLLQQLLREEPQFMALMDRTLREEPPSAVPVLCAIRTPEAFQRVRDFALGADGAFTDRLIALSYLRDAGEIAEDEPVDILIDGEPQTITLGKHRIVPDRPVELPDQATATLFQEGARLLDSSPEDAYDRWVAVDKAYGQSVQLCMHLARLSNSLGRPEVSGEWLQKALSLDPDFAEAHVAWAAQCLNEGDVRGAMQAARQVEKADVLTVTGFMTYNAIRESLDTLLQSPLADALMEQADMTGDDEAAEANRELAGMLGSMQKSLALTHYLRQRPIRGLREDLSFAEIVHQMDSAVVYNAAWLFGLLPEMEDFQDSMSESADDDEDDEDEGAATPGEGEEPEDPRIEQAREELARRMLDPKLLAEGLPGLPDRDLEGLQWLLEQGGIAPLEEYLASFPIDEGAPSDMMLEYGIVVEGRLGGKMTRLIPTDLRTPLQEALVLVREDMGG
ncbi:MAG: hypothetical protein M3Y56_08630 [Armatimonadota bacterium]|nr:hypothetical protein [Armatimonadota bacterium]